MTGIGIHSLQALPFGLTIEETGRGHFGEDYPLFQGLLGPHLFMLDIPPLPGFSSESSAVLQPGVRIPRTSAVVRGLCQWHVRKCATNIENGYRRLIKVMQRQLQSSQCRMRLLMMFFAAEGARLPQVLFLAWRVQYHIATVMPRAWRQLVSRRHSLTIVLMQNFKISMGKDHVFVRFLILKAEWIFTAPPSPVLARVIRLGLYSSANSDS